MKLKLTLGCVPYVREHSVRGVVLLLLFFPAFSGSGSALQGVLWGCGKGGRGAPPRHRHNLDCRHRECLKGLTGEGIRLPSINDQHLSVPLRLPCKQNDSQKQKHCVLVQEH